MAGPLFNGQRWSCHLRIGRFHKSAPLNASRATNFQSGGNCVAGSIYQWDLGVLGAGASRTVHPTMGVRGSPTDTLNALVAASDVETLRAALANTGGDTEFEGRTTEAWRVRAVADWAVAARLVPPGQEYNILREAWQAALPQARTVLRAWRSDDAIHLELRADGVDPEALVQLLGVLEDAGALNF